MGDQVDFPLLMPPWPLSDTGGAFFVPREMVPGAYAGMTVFLADDAFHRRKGQVIAATGGVIIQIAYPPKRLFEFLLPWHWM
jgi:hypothetical protein